jgi:hypothetical protein
MRDAYHDDRSSVVIDPVAMTTANANGAGIDLLGYEGCRLVVQVGTSGALLGVSNLATIRFMESSNNVVFSAIADTDLIGGNNTQVIDANGETPAIHQRSYTGSARYVTVRIEPTGTIAVPFSAAAELGKPIA